MVRFASLCAARAGSLRSLIRAQALHHGSTGGLPIEAIVGE
jgi:hypothetical protein